MSEYFFGLRPGPSHEGAEEIAVRHGAHVTDYTDAECRCGYGCSPHTCPKSRRHWYTCPQYGEPFDSSTARAVRQDLSRAGLLPSEVR